MKKYRKLLTKNFLVKEYIDNKKSTRTIAKLIGCSKGVILASLRIHNIKVRDIIEYCKIRRIK